MSRLLEYDDVINEFSNANRERKIICLFKGYFWPEVSESRRESGQGCEPSERQKRGNTPSQCVREEEKYDASFFLYPRAGSLSQLFVEDKQMTDNGLN